MIQEQNLITICPSVPLNQNELIELIEVTHQNMLLDKAFELVNIYKQRYQNDPKEFIKDITIQRLFNEIIKFHEEMVFLLEQLQDTKDWICESQTEKSSLQYKLIPNTKTVSLKCQEKMEIPVHNTCALIYQAELFNQWIPFCRVSETIKQINKAHKVAYMLIQAPIVHNRESLIRGYGIDRLDIDGSFMICSKSIQNDKDYLDTYRIKLNPSNNVQADINFFALQAKMINKNLFILTSVCNIDPKINFLPHWMLNFLIRKFEKILFDKFIRLAKNIKGSKWEEAMNSKENEEFYNCIGNRLNQYFKEPLFQTQL